MLNTEDVALPLRSPKAFLRSERLDRFGALLYKEGKQIFRDPSSILIAFILPLILLFLFGYGVSLDSARARIAVINQSSTRASHDLVASFVGSKYFNVQLGRDRREFYPAVVSGELRGLVVIPPTFGRDPTLRSEDGTIQVLTDGADPHSANLLQHYANAVAAGWLQSHTVTPALRLQERFWFNPDLTSKFVLVPGSIAIIMTLIGTLLTALVIAREWERGTMEALMATPVGIFELLVAKLLPYYLLGIISLLICTSIAVLHFEVPFRGSLWALLAVSSCFLWAALGQGLLISAATKNQFLASQAALISGFFPGFLLSGFLFEISSMPTPIRWATHLIASSYFVPCLHSIFLVGDLWPLFLRDMAAMVLIGCVFFGLATKNTRRTLG